MDCIDYRRHERKCPHTPHTERWRTDDGCSGSTCGAACRQTGWTDVTELTRIDRDGIPFDSSKQTRGDHIGILLRGLTRD